MFGSKEGGTTEQPELCRGKIIGEPNFDNAPNEADNRRLGSTSKTRPVSE
jgi:hypothetical protein